MNMLISIIKAMVEYPKLSHFFERVFKALILILMLFEEIKVLLIAVLALITLDQFTGVWKAIKLRSFSWRVFNQLYSKVILYLTVIMATYVFGEFLLELETHYFTKAIATVIGFQELISSYSNISAITGQKYIKDFTKVLMKKFKQ